jgi:hypothetical protein
MAVPTETVGLLIEAAGSWGLSKHLFVMTPSATNGLMKAGERGLLCYLTELDAELETEAQ